MVASRRISSTSDFGVAKIADVRHSGPIWEVMAVPDNLALECRSGRWDHVEAVRLAA